MSYTYLLEQGEESSAECFSDIPAFVLSRSNLIAEKYSCKDNGTESFQSSQSGMMSAPSMDGHGEGLSMSCAPESHASALALLEREGDSSTRTITKPLSESFVKLDPITSSWKIPQRSFLEDLERFSGTWPRWGMMLDGECWVQTPVDFHIIEPEFGWLPTPSGVNGGKNHTMGRVDEWGGSSNPLRGTQIGKALSPNFEEIVMGWPTDWTALTQLETDKFQQWLSLHG